MMGDFPKNRVAVPKRAFRDVGLNFAGPFWFRKAPKTMMKVYKAIFVCFATKAVHLELVSDLTAQGCLAALKRFIARRGSPEVICSYIAAIWWVPNPKSKSVISAKKSLRWIRGNRALTFEELTTLICQIEWVLNSSPLCTIWEDPNYVDPLTPAHFTIGGEL